MLYYPIRFVNSQNRKLYPKQNHGTIRSAVENDRIPAILKADTDEGYRIDKTVHGPPVCFLPGMGHVEYDFQLDPGDRIFLYTDGVTEAKRSDGERFGNARLISAL